jgi:D-glycero-D-manno-heptose 1,7-bisphosphate phosphatase
VAVTRRRRAAFIDKDGTLIRNVPYNVDPARVALLPGVIEGLCLLQAAGYALVVVSNQPGVALGLFDYGALRTVELRIDALTAEAGVAVMAYAWCPHHPAGVRAAYAGTCDCRKPAPGLLIEAAARHALDLQASWMIGDILDDVEAGHRAGCRAVLVDRGGETQWKGGPGRTPDAIVDRFDEAAAFIVGPAVSDARASIGGAHMMQPIAVRR